MLFEAEFAREVNRQLAEKQSSPGVALPEQLGALPGNPKDSILTKKRFEVAGDDEYKTLKWRSFMKACAWYIDVPTLDDERKMKREIQRNYDDLFTPGWRPPLTSRRDLLTWGCNQWAQS